MNNRINVFENIFDPIADFRVNFGHLFQDGFKPKGAEFLVHSNFVPSCEVEEQDDHFLITLDVPGVKKEDLKIDLIDNQISISGERQNPRSVKKDELAYSERRFGKFQRNFKVPAGLDVEKVEANYQDGVLRLFIPKPEVSKPRQIKISNENDELSFLGKLLGGRSKQDHSLNSSSDRVAS